MKRDFEGLTIISSLLNVVRGRMALVRFYVEMSQSKSCGFKHFNTEKLDTFTGNFIL